MKQIFINFKFSIFDLNLTILDLVFLTMVISMSLVNFHMSGMGRKSLKRSNGSNWSSWS